MKKSIAFSLFMIISVAAYSMDNVTKFVDSSNKVKVYRYENPNNLVYKETVRTDGISVVIYDDYSIYAQTKTVGKKLFYTDGKKIGDISGYAFPETNGALKKQTKYLPSTGTTTLLADFDYDEKADYLEFHLDDYDCGISIHRYFDPDFKDLIEGYNYSSTAAAAFKGKGENGIAKSYYENCFSFCIVNGRRGIRIKRYIAEENDVSEQSVFLCWSPARKAYVIDKNATPEQIKNALIPEDYFAYNGLKFSKLSSKLTDSDLKNLDKAQLRILRNAIYARYGKTFKSVDLQSLFECYSWYKKNQDYSDSMINDVDRYNIQMILKYEK